MGIIHKLKAEIKEFILEEKKNNPIMSSRGISLIIWEKFQIKVSKSSINSLIKESGLSLPVGRRGKKKRRKLKIITGQTPPLLVHKIELSVAPEPEIKAEKPLEPPPEPQIEPPPEPQIEPKIEFPSEIQCSGAILLRAADYLIEGSPNITITLKNVLNRGDSDLSTKTESLIYLSLFEDNFSELGALLNKQLSQESISSYLNELQLVNTAATDVLRVMNKALQEIRCIKITLVDGNIFYLDGQMHNIWSTPYIPYDFSATLYNIKSYINNYFYKDTPFTLFMAPGYETPTKEFFNFILSLDTREKSLVKTSLYDNNLNEVEVIQLEQVKKRFFIFGLWPWQFVEFRKVIRIGEFKPFHFEALKKDFYGADIFIELLQPIAKQSVKLWGCALKTNISEKTRLVILSNLAHSEIKPEEVAKIYLSHWSNLEETFQDYSRKIELFTYTANSQHFLSTETVGLGANTPSDLKGLFKNYLQALDLYVRWHFLPAGYEDKDFPTVKEEFYDLRVILKQDKDLISVTFRPPANYQRFKELEYACRRLNEREIFSFEGKRLWFRSF